MSSETTSDNFEEKVVSIIARTMANAIVGAKNNKNYEGGNELHFATKEIVALHQEEITNTFENLKDQTINSFKLAVKEVHDTVESIRESHNPKSKSPSDSFKETLEDYVERVAKEVHLGTKRDKDYDFQNDVNGAVEDIMEAYNTGPDVLIISDGLDINCYSDEPDRLGKVLLWGINSLPQTDQLKPMQLVGYSRDWTEELNSERDGGSKFDPKNFLVRFLERNLIEEENGAIDYYKELDVKTF